MPLLPAYSVTVYKVSGLSFSPIGKAFTEAPTEGGASVGEQGRAAEAPDSDSRLRPPALPSAASSGVSQAGVTGGDNGAHPLCLPQDDLAAVLAHHVETLLSEPAAPVLAVAEQIGADEAMEIIQENFHERALQLEAEALEARASFHAALQSRGGQ